MERRKVTPAAAAQATSPVRRALYFIFVLIAALVFFTAIVVSLYSLGIISYSALIFYADAAASLSFLAAAISYLRYVDVTGDGIASRLGLARRFLSWRNLLLAFLVFVIVLQMELAVQLIGDVANTQISTNVNVLLAGAPAWYLIFAAVIAPINEEVLFRGVMVPRIGIVASSVIFALLHASYGSTYGIEVIAAFAFGAISGYVYKKTNSLYPSIIAHSLVNVLAVLALVGRI